MLQLATETVYGIPVDDGHIIVKYNELGIIEVSWKKGKHPKPIQKEEIVKLKDLVGKIGKGRNLPVYISTHDFMSSTPEAKQFAASEEGKQYTLATAVLIDNLSKRILFNFFLQFYKQVKPIKGFSSKEKAFEWLLSFED